MKQTQHFFKFITVLVACLAAVGCTVPNTIAPPGDLRKFDPVKNFSAMASFAGPEALLKSLEANNVSSDGTIDLEEDDGSRVRAHFVTSATTEDIQHFENEESRIGISGTGIPGGHARLFKVGDKLETNLQVRSPRSASYYKGASGSVSNFIKFLLDLTVPGFFYISWDYGLPKRHLGMEREPGKVSGVLPTIIEPPRCSFAQLWQKAIERGVRADAVVNIHYDNDGYIFHENKGNNKIFALQFGKDCALIIPHAETKN